MLVHVGSLREHPLLLADKEIAEADGRGREVLDDCLRLTTAAGVTAQTTLLQGRASEQILRFARRYRPQLIVMGTRGLTGPKSLLLGSVSRDVSKGADCSVLLAR